MDSHNTLPLKEKHIYLSNGMEENKAVPISFFPGKDIHILDVLTINARVVVGTRNGK